MSLPPAGVFTILVASRAMSFSQASADAPDGGGALLVSGRIDLHDNLGPWPLQPIFGSRVPVMSASSISAVSIHKA
jgi:hypothetical protein